MKLRFTKAVVIAGQKYEKFDEARKEETTYEFKPEMETNWYVLALFTNKTAVKVSDSEPVRSGDPQTAHDERKAAAKAKADAKAAAKDGAEKPAKK